MTLYLSKTYYLTLSLPQYAILSLFEHTPALTTEQIRSLLAMSKSLFETQIQPMFSTNREKSLLTKSRPETLGFVADELISLNFEYRCENAKKCFVETTWKKRDKERSNGESTIMKERNVKINRRLMLEAAIIKIIKVL